MSRFILEFSGLVEKHFDYLVTDYGFELTVLRGSLVVYASPVCEVEVTQEFANVGVGIAPPGDDPSKGTSKTRWLGRIVNFKEGSRTAFRSREFDDPAYDSDPVGIIDRDLAYHANMLRRYCDEMLRGDFSQIPPL